VALSKSGWATAFRHRANEKVKQIAKKSDKNFFAFIETSPLLNK
jgi:hypothetical protein